MDVQVTIRCNNGGYKFVVLINEREEMIVFADDNDHFDYHWKLLAQYQHETGLRASCIGGGRIRFDGEKKTIEIWDSSGDFGYEPDRNQTVSAIKQNYLDFEVVRRG